MLPFTEREFLDVFALTPRGGRARDGATRAATAAR